MRKTLAYTATTASEKQLSFKFPLHPLTASSDHVARLLSDLLAAIGGSISAEKSISDGDILQALAMTLAIRTRMVEAADGPVHKLAAEIVETVLRTPSQTVESVH